MVGFGKDYTECKRHTCTTAGTEGGSSRKLTDEEAKDRTGVGLVYQKERKKVRMLIFTKESDATPDENILPHTHG